MLWRLEVYRQTMASPNLFRAAFWWPFTLYHHMGGRQELSGGPFYWGTNPISTLAEWPLSKDPPLSTQSPGGFSTGVLAFHGIKHQGDIMLQSFKVTCQQNHTLIKLWWLFFLYINFISFSPHPFFKNIKNVFVDHRSPEVLRWPVCQGWTHLFYPSQKLKGFDAVQLSGNPQSFQGQVLAHRGFYYKDEDPVVLGAWPDSSYLAGIKSFSTKAFFRQEHGCLLCCVVQGQDEDLSEVKSVSFFFFF